MMWMSCVAQVTSNAQTYEIVIRWDNKSYTPWREDPGDRWSQYKIVIHMNVLLHSIIICPLPELGTLGIFEFFNIKKLFFCILIKLVT